MKKKRYFPILSSTHYRNEDNREHRRTGRVADPKHEAHDTHAVKEILHDILNKAFETLEPTDDINLSLRSLDDPELSDDLGNNLN